MDKTKLTHEPPMPARLRLHLDEAGRGPLAGPVSVGCVLALGRVESEGFQDSKILSEKTREVLYTKLESLQDSGALNFHSGFASNKEIDQRGIILALQTASIRAIFFTLRKYFFSHWKEKLHASVYGDDHIALTQLSQLFGKKTPNKNTLAGIIHTPNSVAKIETIIIDGNHSFGLDTALDINVVTIIKGDSKNALISMASIVAKVERDRFVQGIAKKLPDYGLDRHKGYGTKKHRESIRDCGVSEFHRETFCGNIKKNNGGLIIDDGKGSDKKDISTLFLASTGGKKIRLTPLVKHKDVIGTGLSTFEKPKLLLHICCAPDLSWPLHWLKNHFKLYLFRYNPNIHPRKEHTKRYDAFIKLIGLEDGDYEIVEDRYDPKEFFQSMVREKEDIDPSLKNAPKREVLKVAGEMEERSSRCNPCYSNRLAVAAENAAKHGVEYFTSTLLISPKKKMDKLFRRGIEGERRNPTTKFLRFNFAKNKGYEMATKLTKKHGLFRQNYCGCGWTIPKKGEENKSYSGG